MKKNRGCRKNIYSNLEIQIFFISAITVLTNSSNEKSVSFRKTE